MAHCLIAGQTESGKTTLAKQLARAYKAAGKGVIVLDPMNDPEWECDYRTADQAEFIRVFKASTACAVFIDEAGESVGRFQDEMHFTATRGRHLGHDVHYISQRPAMIARNVRTNCSKLFLFNTALNDCKELAQDFNEPRILEARNLPQFHYYAISRFAPFKQGVITFDQP